MADVTYSFIPGEIIRPGDAVEIKAVRRVSPSFVQSAVSIKSDDQLIKNIVQLKEDSIIQSKSPITEFTHCLTSLVLTKDLKPGIYEVNIDHLADFDNKLLTEKATTNFIVGALRGTVPKGSAVIHAVQLAVGDLTSERLTPGSNPPRGTTYVEICKVIDRRTHEIQVLAFGANGKYFYWSIPTFLGLPKTSEIDCIVF